MKIKTVSEIKSEARDLFSYILIGCPNFPMGTGSTTAKEFAKLIDYIDAIRERTKSEDAKQWLRICLQEVRLSWKHYDDNNLKGGREMIQQAEEHFKNALSKKPIEARFVTDESGAAQDSDSGFPT